MRYGRQLLRVYYGLITLGIAVLSVAASEEVQVLQEEGVEFVYRLPSSLRATFSQKGLPPKPPMGKPFSGKVVSYHHSADGLMGKDSLNHETQTKYAEGTHSSKNGSVVRLALERHSVEKPGEEKPCVARPSVASSNVEQPVSNDTKPTDDSTAQPQDVGILVLVGGRHWSGRKTLETFGFEKFADKLGLLLIAPSFTGPFKGKDYWEPSQGTGELLLAVLQKLRQKYGLKKSPLLMYGYSAGGQFVSLCSEFMPKEIQAWAVHGCGVYPERAPKAGPPALISCGRGDADRVRISRHYAYLYREASGSLLWIPHEGGHELTKDDLRSAEAFFQAQILGSLPDFFGEDDTGRLVDAQEKELIDIEFSNPLYSQELKEFWSDQSRTPSLKDSTESLERTSKKSPPPRPAQASKVTQFPAVDYNNISLSGGPRPAQASKVTQSSPLKPLGGTPLNSSSLQSAQHVSLLRIFLSPQILGLPQLERTFF